MATQKDRETFGGDKFGQRYVRVYPTQESDVADMTAAVISNQMQQNVSVRPANRLCSVDVLCPTVMQSDACKDLVARLPRVTVSSWCPSDVRTKRRRGHCASSW